MCVCACICVSCITSSFSFHTLEMLKSLFGQIIIIIILMLPNTVQRRMFFYILFQRLKDE